MRVLANTKLIQRNSRIGKYANGAAILILLGGLGLSLLRTNLFWLSAVTLVLGFGLSQFSFRYINRFGRTPRLDEQVVSSLKGLSNDFTLYQYNTAVSHLLVGPAGVWIIMPYYQRGTITYQGGRWRQKNTGIAGAYMRVFAQEGLGRPDLDLQAETISLQRFFEKNLEGEQPDIRGAMLFVDKRADLQVEDAPVPTLRPQEMKELIRRAAKETPLPAEDAKRIKAVLPQEDREARKPAKEKP
jgi:hypothetical protein